MSDTGVSVMKRLLIALMKLIAGLLFIWLMLLALFLWPIMFHDDSKVSDHDLDVVLSAFALTRNDVSVRQSYYAPPNWAGDYTRAFCLMSTRVPSTNGFVAGDVLAQVDSNDPQPYSSNTVNMMKGFLKSARQEAAWLPAERDWLSGRYLIKLLYTGSTSAHFAWLDTRDNAACFLALKW